PRNPQKLLVASLRGVFEETQNGFWKQLWGIQGENNRIHRLLYFKTVPHALFVLTQNGAFKGDLKHNRWEKIYGGKSPDSRAVLSFAVLPEDPDHWFLGTPSGLYESDNAGKTWFRFSRFSEKEPVSVIAFIRDRLFIGAENQLLVSEDLIHFKPRFSLPLTSSEQDNLDFESSQTDERIESILFLNTSLHAIAVFEDDSNHLWLGTSKGVFESRDSGNSWSPLSTSGLKELNIEHLVYAARARKLIAGTSKGIYAFDLQTQRWEELFQGLAQARTFGIALPETDNETLVALTQDGFMRYPLIPEEWQTPSTWIPSPETIALLSELVRLEPSARDVHKAVVRYGNLSNWKIKRWHAASRFSALIPSVSFGRDFSNSSNIDLDRGGTLDPDVYILGPENQSRGWDMDVRWDLGAFLWSSSQTSIDSREKLMVELRNDFLADATRVYYERRRLQTEIAFSSADSGQERFEKLIRLDELTSLLDAMTNGYFSERLAKVYGDHPELKKLWNYTKS
ncbi:MAG TPA: hypothetical protein VD913_05255, partial [bacterium]|nr:hypothetical protein [bacterium]